MTLLKEMNNMQKAKLLHTLFRTEIADFLAGIELMSNSVLDSQELIKTVWKQDEFEPEFWLTIAGDISVKTKKYKSDMIGSSHIFAEQLFTGTTAIFSIHALVTYVAENKHTDPRFKLAVELLF